jgi:hypothetical protein
VTFGQGVAAAVIGRLVAVGVGAMVSADHQGTWRANYVLCLEHATNWSGTASDEQKAACAGLADRDAD